MDIKKKFKSVVTHVKSHPAFYGYMVGVAVTATAIAIAQKSEIEKFLSTHKIVDMDVALDQIADCGGIYYRMDDVNTILMTMAPEDFDPLTTPVP